MNEALQPKEIIFLEAYSTSFNITQAAITAGYSERGADVRGVELLRKERVQKALKKRLKLVLKKQKLSPEFVLTGLREVFERCMQLKEVTDKEGRKLGVFKFEPRAALKALELIGKNYDMFSPDVVVNLNIELDQQLSTARKRIADIARTNKQTKTTGKKPLKDVTAETKEIKPLSPKKDGLEALTIGKLDSRLA